MKFMRLWGMLVEANSQTKTETFAYTQGKYAAAMRRPHVNPYAAPPGEPIAELRMHSAWERGYAESSQGSAAPAAQ